MRYSITTCICACSHTDLVHFSNYFKLIFFPKRQKFLQTSNFTASWETRLCLQLGQNQRSIQQGGGAQPPPPTPAPAWVPAAAAAPCPEVLWSDEVGPVSNRYTHARTHATTQHTHLTRQACVQVKGRAQKIKRLMCWNESLELQVSL